MKKVVRIKESELVNLIDKIITETTRKQKITEGVRNLAGKQIINEEMVLKEEANTDLELKSVAKKIFSVLKKYGLNPNYISGNVKLDKSDDSVVTIVKDTNTGTGLIKVNIWAWAVSKNKIDMKKLNSDIVQILGNEFENKSGQTSSGNDIIYSMIIRKKVGQQRPQSQQQPVSENLRIKNYFK